MLGRIQSWVVRELSGEPYDQADLVDELEGWEGQEPPNASWLYDLLLETERYGRAVAAWKAAIESLLLEAVKNNGAQRFGQEVLTTKAKGGRQINDVVGLVRWLDTAENVRLAFNLKAKDARLGALKMIAKQREQAESLPVDTFFTKPSGERVLSRLPVDGANTPKWAKNLREEE